MVVGAVGDQLGPAAHQAVGESLGVVGHPLRVGLERRLARFGEGDRLGRHHVRHRAAQDHRTAFVHRVGVFLGGQHEAAARPAQRFVGGTGDDVGVRHRILVAAEHLAGDQPGEMCHVDHEGGTDLIGDLPHRGEVDPARIREQHVVVVGAVGDQLGPAATAS